MKIQVLDGIAYDYNFVKELRIKTISRRDIAQEEGRIIEALDLSHTVEILAHYAELLKETKVDAKSKLGTDPDSAIV